MKIAFADSPYYGCCKLYDHRHEAPWGCWDDYETHAELLTHLDDEYDGWVYCMTSTSLPVILPLAPEGTRIGSWVKPFAAFKRNVRVAYTWEPVLFKPARGSSKTGAPVGRDHLRTVEEDPAIAESITMKKGLTGAKPKRFCEWALDIVGYIEGDEVIDLFPGTGIMGEVLAQGRVVSCART